MYFVPDPGNRNVQATKAAWRRALTTRRRSMNPDLREVSDWKTANHLRTVLASYPGALVALYYPRGAEVNLLPLAEDLTRAGYALALPRVAYKGHPLVFNSWQPGDALERDELGLWCAAGEEVVPHIIVAPMLGYSKSGYRLGQGGGYYDMTLKARRTPALALGVCHTELEVEPFPAEYADVRLDAIITPRGVF